MSYVLTSILELHVICTYIHNDYTCTVCTSVLYCIKTLHVHALILFCLWHHQVHDAPTDLSLFSFLLPFSPCAGITLLYFLARSSDYSSVWRDGDPLVQVFITIDILTSTLPFLLSVTYHTFMPHHAGKQLYQSLLKMDVFGVWFATTFGSLSAMYVSLYCVPTIRQMYLLVYLLLSLIVLYYLVVLDCKRQRVAAFTIQFFLRSLIHLVRLTPMVTVDTSAFYYFLFMNIFSSIGALINALHIPECWFPGKCDYVLNGHSLMHIMAFLSLTVGRQGTLIDFAWLNSNPSCPA